MLNAFSVWWIAKKEGASFSINKDVSGYNQRFITAIEVSVLVYSSFKHSRSLLSDQILVQAFTSALKWSRKPEVRLLSNPSEENRGL